MWMDLGGCTLGLAPNFRRLRTSSMNLIAHTTHAGEEREREKERERRRESKCIAAYEIARQCRVGVPMLRLLPPS